MSAFLIYILKVALLTAVFALLYHLLLRRDTFHRMARIVLVSSLVISYILPFCVITIHKPIVLVENREMEVVQTPATVPATQDNQQAQPALLPSQVQMQPQLQSVTTTDANHRQIDWIAITAVIYALGVVILIALRLLSVQKVLRIIRRGQVSIERDGCKIVISKDNVRPFSWMRNIVLPESQADLSWTSSVVRHEQSHVSHHHSAELLATDILSAFQWFNPAVWLLRHDLCCVQEFEADASVLESGLDKVEYEKSLLSIATGGLSIPLVNGLGESYLRTRIRMMNRKLSRKVNLVKLVYLPVVILVSLSLMANTVFDDETIYWDSYTDVTPGIKSIEVNDRDVQGSTTTFNENGMQVEHLNWVSQEYAPHVTVIRYNGVEHYDYDEMGRLVSRRTTTADVALINIEYGHHGKYVPVCMGTPNRGEILTLMDTRLIKDVSAISIKFFDGTVVRHVFVPDGNRLIHKYPYMTTETGTVEKQQIIEYNDRGLPYYIETEEGHIGPVAYQPDGGFDSIPEFHGKPGEPQWTIIYKYAPGTHNTSEIIRITDDMTTRTLYSHNDKGDLLNSLMYVIDSNGQLKQNYTYEYDSHGNWIKRMRDIYPDATPISEVMTRVIKYYDDEVYDSKKEYQELLSKSYMLTPDSLRTVEQLDLQLRVGDFMNSYVTVQDNHMKLSAPRIVLKSRGIPSFYYDIIQYQIDENNAFIDNLFEENAFTEESFDVEKMLMESKTRYSNKERRELVSRIEDLTDNSGDLNVTFSDPTTGQPMSLTTNLDEIPLLIVLDRTIVDIDPETLAGIDADKQTFSRKELASILNVKPRQVKAYMILKGNHATSIWGMKGANGVLDVLSRNMYRQLKKEGKLDKEYLLAK